jgi:type III secretion protein Q
VVLFDDLRLTGTRLEGSLRLGGPGFELRGPLGPEGFLPQGASSALSQEYSVMIEPVNDETAAALPVDVEVVLTRLRLSLADLAAIKPGALLPLHINVTEPVLLRVGDRTVARAELVEIDGEVGARILALLP